MAALQSWRWGKEAAAEPANEDCAYSNIKPHVDGL